VLLKVGLERLQSAAHAKVSVWCATQVVVVQKAAEAAGRHL